MPDQPRPIRYAIDARVFERFPGYLRAVVLAREVTNIPSPAALVELLRAAEESARRSLAGQDLSAHAGIHAWREAYRALGVKPTEFRPSMEAMLRRVLNGHDLPAINALVDIGNIVSLRHLLPVGGHALDRLEGDVSLRPAHGGETYIPFANPGDPQPPAEQPPAGEFIFAEGDTVLTRRWTWRQSARTMTTLETAFVGYNVDILPPVTRAQGEDACGEIGELVTRFCGGRLSTRWLTPDQPMMDLTE
jgi:DNA/RNA-binding domain of Phe-tRNA-synthetase-like protein